MLRSDYLTLGAPDVNGKVANSIGSVSFAAFAGNPATPADEADVNLELSLTDVRKQTDLSDYTGQLQLNTLVRITDKHNDELAGGGTDPATVSDFPLNVPVTCAATPDTTIGGACSVATTLDAVVPSLIKEGVRSSWQLGAVQLFDGGSDGAGVDGPEHPVRPPGRIRPVVRSRRDLTARLAPGARAGLPLAAAGLLLGISFGVVAEPLMGHIAPVVMSAIVFAGAAQFAATAVLADGGSAAAAIVAGILLNLRFIPMGIAIAPSLHAPVASRAAVGQGMVDASWAMANRGERALRRPLHARRNPGAVPGLGGGAAIGVLAGDVIGNPEDLGLDAIFPAFFLALLVNELRDGMSIAAALIGAALALALTPFVPPGIPVLAACAGAALGLVRR